MRIGIKKLHGRKVIRSSGEGEIKEIMMHTDILNPQSDKLSIGFRGENNSGIIELNAEEAKHLHKVLGKKLKLIKSIKVIKEW